MPGVYLSYPFCAQKCTFCNFASGVFLRRVEERYLSALRAEIAAHRWEWTPRTVYLGGGTPSLMDVAPVLALVPGRPWHEATIEAAPGTVTADRARTWIAAGIDRVSLGVQSFVRREILRTGRKHTAETVVGDVHILRSQGVRAINIDLIAGLAGQSEESWCESLDWIERLEPEHVSVYMLEVDENSRLGREILGGGGRYGAPDVAGEERTAGFYETAVERLAAMDILRYEISNFARPGFQSAHNLKYWRLEPYAGFGAGAHSFDGRLRRRNPETVAQYVAGRPAEVEPARSDERFMVGLRLSEGIRPRPDEWRRYRTPIERFTHEGLLEFQDGALRLTARGVLLSNEVLQEFLA